MDRRTKIVATLGPACDTPEAIAGLVAAGMDVARLGLAHGTVDDHLERLDRVRTAAAAAGRTVAVLADLPGPKVRCAPFPEDGVFLAEEAVVSLVPGDAASSSDAIEVDYASLLEDLAPGDRVTLGDGALVLAVEAHREGGLLARVVAGGRVMGSPGVHLPDERVRLATPTAEDLALVDALVPAGVDAVALSFVRSAEDLHRARAALDAAVTRAGTGVMPVLLAKIETRAAADRLDDVMEAADAVMVARGDLAISCPIEEVPHLQKRIVRSCVGWGRPVITATQMLES
ncbi:MAG: pyruvate kinase, partial [Acidimicrobiales bacterium]